LPVIVPDYHHIMGTIGVTQLAREEVQKAKFMSFHISGLSYRTGSFECGGCPDTRENAEIYEREQSYRQVGQPAASAGILLGVFSREAQVAKIIKILNGNV